ncbi:ubiquitin carboxyl-terminal hydrolase 15-like [Bradysia coprophila]|uniref:ubiquitin carboxyl-terminal hydrolase 15-like n=1 Tax=Bradysia coprophila TaxID=38358 RepID=UPI00187DD231|nr:ubiquitin carboxyl-terminal hydrolase 15-like [Bradysia coprophila]
MSPPLDDESPMEVEESMPTGDINLDDVRKIVEKPMCKGESWYLVDKKWYEQFEKFVTDKEPTHNPGPIDNSKLFNSSANGSFELRDQLEEELDYKFVPEEAWQMLYGYFGIQNDRHTIKRWVIEEGHNSTSCTVEIYLVDLKLCSYERQNNFVTSSYSRMTTLHDLEDDMKRLFKFDPSRESKMYHLNTLLDTDDGKTLADVSITHGDIVVLEVRSKNGTWPSSVQRSTVTRSATGMKAHAPGLCGLTNLGNTCFMNSALQCLSNTPPLTEFITSDKYLAEINRNNPLGMDGRIAEAYGDLIKNMWSGNMNCFTPRDFKYVVGSFAPQFSGYAQQDCQELMAFLLDGLHEDLNRITKKPYIELKTDVDQRPDLIVANESWENYKKRNDSIIVDTFHGLLKSTLVCPDCELVSVTFDPFCYLSLPLPVKRERQIDVIFVPADAASEDSNGNRETEVAFLFSGLTVPKYGAIGDICRALALAVDREKILDHQIDHTKLIVADVYHHRIHRIFEHEEAIVSQLKDLVIYEMPPNGSAFPVYFREVQPDGEKFLFGRPFFVGVNEPHYDALRDKVAQHLCNYNRTVGLDDSTDSDEMMSADGNGTELFSLTLTNSMGTIDIVTLDPHTPIQLNRNSYLAVDLPSKAKAKYYDPERENPFKVALHKSTNQSRSSIALSECIHNFTTTEKLGADDSWYCPTCKKHQQATKKFDLWEVPNVLIIHLKRFSYSRHWRDKLDTSVDFPITGLDMGAHVLHNPDKKSILYDLIAVSNHYGSLGGGHYSAYAKNSETSKWYYFNDSSVSESDEKDVVSKQAYVLYYLKRNEV